MDLSERSVLLRRVNPDDGAARLVPVLARAIETGQGPPRLLRWLAEQPRGSGPPNVARLAAELNRAVRRAGVAETVTG